MIYLKLTVNDDESLLHRILGPEMNRVTEWWKRRKANTFLEAKETGSSGLLPFQVSPCFISNIEQSVNAVAFRTHELC